MSEPVPRWRRRAYSVEAMRALARAALPRPVFDFADGGAEDETTLRRNEAAFDGEIVTVQTANGPVEAEVREMPLMRLE